MRRSWEHWDASKANGAGIVVRVTVFEVTMGGAKETCKGSGGRTRHSLGMRLEEDTAAHVSTGALASPRTLHARNEGWTSGGAELGMGAGEGNGGGKRGGVIDGGERILTLFS